MCFRKTPSKVAPMQSNAPRTRRFRASVLNSTRIAFQLSKALRSRRYFVSMFAAVPRLDVEVARRAHRAAVDVDYERNLRVVLQREVEPAVEAQRVQVREAMD